MDTKHLFSAALGLQAPWQITSIDFDEETPDGRGRLEIRIDFERGGRFPCVSSGKSGRWVSGNYGRLWE